MERPLNICLVSREYPPETGWGGIGTYTYNLAQGLANLGHQVHVISQSLDSDKEYFDRRVFVHRIAHQIYFAYKGFLGEFGLRLEYSYRVYQKVKELMDKFRIDIVEVPNFSGEGFIYSIFKKTPLVTRLHTHFSGVIESYQWPRTFDRRLSCWFEDFSILRSDLVTCSTRTHIDTVFNEIGIKFRNVKVIPLGIPLPYLNENNFENKNYLEILFVGRLEKRKGIHILIKAIPYVLEEYPNTEFFIIGRDTFVNDTFVSFTGNSKDSFKYRLEKDIPSDIRNKIHFLGYMNNFELSNYYASCDIFVAPSLYESFGLIYIEAMSYGKPVIGCSTGGVPEVIKDNITGIIIPPNDHISIAKAILRLIKDKELRIEMGKNARKYTEENFTQELMARRTLMEYKKLLKI